MQGKFVQAQNNIRRDVKFHLSEVEVFGFWMVGKYATKVGYIYIVLETQMIYWNRINKLITLHKNINHIAFLVIIIIIIICIVAYFVFFFAKSPWF